MSLAQGFVFVLLNLLFLPFMAHRLNHRWWAYLIRGVLIGVGAAHSRGNFLQLGRGQGWLHTVDMA